MPRTVTARLYAEDVAIVERLADLGEGVPFAAKARLVLRAAAEAAETGCAARLGCREHRRGA